MFFTKATITINNYIRFSNYFFLSLPFLLLVKGDSSYDTFVTSHGGWSVRKLVI